MYGAQISTIFASGLERIEHAGGGCLRIVLFENKAINGIMERIQIVPDVIIPIDALPDAIGKAMMALGRQVCVRPDGSMTVAH